MGGVKLKTWLEPHAVDLVKVIITKEMTEVVKFLKLNLLEEITSEFLQAWTWESILHPCISVAPMLYSFLVCAAQSNLAKKNKLKTPDIYHSYAAGACTLNMEPEICSTFLSFSVGYRVSTKSHQCPAMLRAINILLGGEWAIASMAVRSLTFLGPKVKNFEPRYSSLL
ncbi:hypothetical protein OF83DRAFT_1173529 [Amylostereum chailletii]|nr:hypothetical protein OF83DRAFT_1173529 [Amylostereum chailletii]